MRHPYKKALCALLIFCLLLAISACGSAKTDSSGGGDISSQSGTNQPSASPAEDGQNVDGQTVDSSDGGETADGETAEEPGDAELTFTNFSSGVIYENGSYLFQIDSMEMTDEGYLITYRAATDTQGYDPYYDMTITVNGITFPYDMFRYSGNGMTGESMIGGGADVPCQVLLDRELLELAGIQEVLSVRFDASLGHKSSSGSAYDDVTFVANVYPGEEVDTSDWFPAPKSGDWVLYDGDEGKLQITGARYWRSASDGAIMGVRFSLLEQGVTDNGTVSIRLDGIDVGGWTAEDCQNTDNYIWLEGRRFSQCTIYCVKEDAPEGLDFSQAVLRLTKEDHSGGGSEEFTVTLDLSGLGA